MIGLIRRIGHIGVVRNILFVIGLIALPAIANAQLHPRFYMHELRPGMMTREIILFAHAPLDTILWGGAEEANVIGFKGAYLNDSGEFRVAVQGPEITQITFISPQRTVEQNEKRWKGVVEKIRKMHGKPSEEYHNKYQMITWEGTGEQLRLTTSDGGRFYTMALTKPIQSTAPASNERTH